MSLRARVGRLEANMSWLEIEGAMLRIHLKVELDRLKRLFAKQRPDLFRVNGIIDWGEKGPPPYSPPEKMPGPPYTMPGARPFKWPKEAFDHARLYQT